MTPKHQAVIDRTLHAVHERAHLVVQSLHPPGKEEPAQGDAAKHRSQEEQMEALRASTLGCQLRWIAEYVEGYPAAKEPERKQRWTWSEEVVVRGGMRREVYAVCAVVYGSAAGGNAWSYPRQCQHTDLGQLLHAALLQFYHEYLPADQLVSVGNAAKEIGIARQTLHEWMESGRAKWISEAEHDVMWLDREEVDRLWHIKRG
ncbi:hypothetical protein KSX_93140 [Ktedonospora formicarum]|uniref:Helix-turn-helix domain-containing protein n=1 Tax=Ktedonospora formicarum TaxID=2778364 RepID=A0A8J3IBW8_9CHLR|nr:hypothetical protein KSX_93140 [Ktedonospora formicarum]